MYVNTHVITFFRKIKRTFTNFLSYILIQNVTQILCRHRAHNAARLSGTLYVLGRQHFTTRLYSFMSVIPIVVIVTIHYHLAWDSDSVLEKKKQHKCLPTTKRATPARLRRKILNLCTRIFVEWHLAFARLHMHDSARKLWIDVHETSWNTI